MMNDPQNSSRRRMSRYPKLQQRLVMLMMVVVMVLVASLSVNAFVPSSQRPIRPVRQSDLASLLLTGNRASNPDAPMERWQHCIQQRSPSSFLLYASTQQQQSSQQHQNPKEDNESSSRKESPLGVRRRVRAVLERAKKRTGIPNNSTDYTTAGVIADAASIGGLGGVLIDDNGTVDVALDFVSKNGATKKRNGSSGSIKDIASTPSTVVKNRLPQDDLTLLQKPEAAEKNGVAKKKNGVKKPTGLSNGALKQEIDAIKAADVPAAFSEPLPFTLPTLTRDQKQRLRDGERIQEQSKMGREGSGYVVLDIKAPPSVVWECLLDFESYPTTIPTVRGVKMLEATPPVRHFGTPSKTRASFVLSKFRLNIAAIHNYRPHPAGDYMVFTLDPDCTNYVLKAAKGIWHTQSNPDGRGEEYTRVWLLCEVKVSSVLPKFIVEYTAKRAMPRATNWLKPQVEAAAQLWLKN
eukprot:CAMPEP_0194040526 /NCGR_PEP_ID=MMETSP0009_2-20130614/12496_1 /TAXON_ID=210454 /ORGANISM="Grammatophora oceanica, Strain CCMP 410" /LENGTH=464 /DNA_ID=CAMNT_0038683683 /DNA_START=45 /DNA_END=1439 /DNA_ORIENTATION=-